MASISLTANGHGQLAVYPSTAPNIGDVVTVRSFPYTGEELMDIRFEEYINGSWSIFSPLQTDWRSWRWRVEYDVRVVATFTERQPAPPDPPSPPPTPIDPPAPIYSNWLIAVLGRAIKNRRRL